MTGDSHKTVRVRMAPSPTGPFHIGSARTALFNWLFARQHDGVFVLRIEDTDTERSKKEHENDILESLKWLGLEWDEGPSPLAADKRGFPTQINADKNIGVHPRANQRTSAVGSHGPYRQSERTKLYRKHLERLLKEEKAYYCYCSKEDLEAQRQAMLGQGLQPKYNGHCRTYTERHGRDTDRDGPANADQRGRDADLRRDKEPRVIRFKTPETTVEFHDIVRGKVSFDASLFGDIVIAKDLDTPLYNFAVVVDDEEMEITHVIRGEDHLSNTPKQILFQRALGFKEPEYAHIPLILNPDRSKMSKRFSDTALSEYRKRGYMPETIVNFLALLGWHPKDNRELFTLDELVGVFDLKRVQKAGAVFNQEKLDWLQREHMKGVSTEYIANHLGPILKARRISVSREFLERVIELERPRAKTIPDILETAGFFFAVSDYEPGLLAWQSTPLHITKGVLERSLRAIAELPEAEFRKEPLLAALKDVIEKEGRGAVLWPLRVALSGLTASPDPLEIMDVLGKEESERRIRAAIDKIS